MKTELLLLFLVALFWEHAASGHEEDDRRRIPPQKPMPPAKPPGGRPLTLSAVVADGKQQGMMKKSPPSVKDRQANNKKEGDESHDHDHHHDHDERWTPSSYAVVDRREPAREPVVLFDQEEARRFLSHHGHHHHDHKSSNHYSKASCGAKVTLDVIGAMGIAYGNWKLAHQHRRDLQSVKYTIDVHFWVFALSDTVGILTDQQEQNLMSVLNKGFQGSAFQFNLIRRNTIINPKGWLCSGTDSLREVHRVAGPNVLNVYFCDMNQVGQFGSATFPPIVRDKNKKDTDGVLLINPSVARNGEKEVFYTLIHEVGHWLGCLHTFENGCKNTVSVKFGFTGLPSWMFDGDGVEDTPAHARQSWSFTGWQTCFVGQPTLDSCPDQPGVDPGVDPIFNYMNYIHEDCMESGGLFTSGQQERMLAQYETFRIPPVADPALVRQCSKQTSKSCMCNAAKAARSQKCAKQFVMSKCTLSSSKDNAKLESDAVLTEYNTACPTAAGPSPPAMGMMRMK